MPFVNINLINLKIYHIPKEKNFHNQIIPIVLYHTEDYCSSLPVQKTNLYRERVYSFTSDNVGSALLEAVVVIPLILAVCIMLMQFIVMVNTENNIYEKLTDVTNDIMTDSYAYDRRGYMYTMADIQLISKMNTRDFRSFVNSSSIKSGINGINYLQSSDMYDNKKSMLVKGSYKVVVSCFFWRDINIVQLQSICFRPFVGESLKSDRNTSNERMVFITESGTVYHTSRDCTHLRLSVTDKKLKEVASLRNSSGGKYYPCEICVKENMTEASTVYIASNGNRYHKNRLCSGLKRSVTEIAYSEVGNRRLCTRCAS